jgi:hypothetical protein
LVIVREEVVSRSGTRDAFSEEVFDFENLGVLRRSCRRWCRCRRCLSGSNRRQNGDVEAAVWGEVEISGGDPLRNQSVSSRGAKVVYRA